MKQISLKDTLRSLAINNRIAFLKDKNNYYWVTITKPGRTVKGRRRSGKGKNLYSLENALIVALGSLCPDIDVPIRNDPLVSAIVTRLVPGKPFFLKPDDPLLA